MVIRIAFDRAQKGGEAVQRIEFLVDDRCSGINFRNGPRRAGVFYQTVRLAYPPGKLTGVGGDEVQHEGGSRMCS